MRHFIYIMISLVLGYSLTLIFYMIGGILVQPALFLAKLFTEDRGGDSLLFPFTIINTAFCSLLIYATLRWAIKNFKTKG